MRLRRSRTLRTKLKSWIKKELHVLLLLLLLLMMLKLLRDLLGLDDWVLRGRRCTMRDHRGHGLRGNNRKLNLMLTLVLMLLLRIERAVHGVGRDWGHEVILNG